MAKKKKKLKVVVANGPVFHYTSECCGKPAKKPPVQRKPEDKAENKFSECSLGTWNCTQCHKPCKVSRTRVKQETDGDTGTSTD